MPETANIASLFTTTKCGDLDLKNRIVYPAMTRARFIGNVANNEVVKCKPILAAAHRSAARPVTLT